MSRIYGLVSKVIYRDEDTGRGIFAIEYESYGSFIQGKMFALAKSAREGDAFSADGEWKEEVWRGGAGQAFQAYRFRPDAPRTLKMAERWLNRLLTEQQHGVPPHGVERALAKWGMLLIEEPHLAAQRIAETTKDPRRFVRPIGDTLEGRFSGRLALSLLEESGLSEPLIVQILSAMPEDAHKLLRLNPYRAAKIPDVGFVNADKIGMHIGIAPDDRRRLLAALEDVARAMAIQGSTIVDMETIVQKIQGLVDISAEKAIAFMRHEAHSTDHHLIIADVGGKIICALRELFQAEIQAAFGAARLLAKGRRNSPQLVATAAADLFKRHDYEHFDAVQRLSVEMAVVEPLSIITGGPGTGKSAVMKAVVALAESWDRAIFLAAPTGAAARKLTEATGQRAQTVHRLLRAREETPGGKSTFGFNADTPLPGGSFVVIDEVSMNDIELMAAIMNAMPEDGRLLLVGDDNQLPSVGPGAVLRDFLALRVGGDLAIPSIQLNKIYRQGPDSGIVHGAAEIAAGRMPLLSEREVAGVSFTSIPASGIGEFVERLVCLNLPSQGFSPLSDIATLCPQAPGPGGTYELNHRLSGRLNPHGAALPGVMKDQNDRSDLPVPRMGDKVMITWNDSTIGIANGDIGYIVGSRISAKGHAFIKIRMEDGTEFEHPASKWRDLLLGYAATIHKSQGSQYPAVIMPILSAHSRMLERRLVFTGWTRAQKKLMLVGEIDALKEAISRQIEPRQTLVQELAHTRPSERALPVDWASRRLEAETLMKIEEKWGGRKSRQGTSSAPYQSSGRNGVDAWLDQLPAPPPVAHPIASASILVGRAENEQMALSVETKKSISPFSRPLPPPPTPLFKL